jgi:5'-3' exoribonuclease 1
VEPTFAKDIARNAEKEDRYMPGFIVAKQLGVSSLAISKITSSMFVMSNRTDQRYNIGLNLKFDSKALKVLGYTQKSDKGWEYSEKAFALIREYYKRFPEVFLTVNKIPARSELLDETLFYKADVVDAKMAEIKSWLKESGAKLLDKAPLNAVALSKDHVEEIQRRMDQLHSSAGPENTTYVSVSGVPRQSVLKPAHSKHRLLHQSFSLGDRVVCTFNEGSVPLGTKGTVVGLDGHLVQVLFDKTFMGGTSLDGRCAPYRGGSVSKETLLNLTHQQPFNRSSRPLSAQRGESRGANGSSSKGYGKTQNYQTAAPVKNAWEGKKSAENVSRSKDEFYQTLGVQKPRAPQSAPPKKAEPLQQNKQAPRKTEPVPSTHQSQTIKKEEVSSSGLKVQLSRKQGSASSAPGPPQSAVNTDEMTMNLKSMLKIQGGPGAQPRPPVNPMMSVPQPIPGMPMPQQYPGMVPQQYVSYPAPYGYAPPYGYPPMMPGQIPMPTMPHAPFRPQSIQTAGMPVAVATKTETVTSVTTQQSMGNQNVLHGIMSTLQGQSPSNGSPYSSSTPAGASGWRPPTDHNELEHLVKGQRGGRGGRGRGRGRGRGGAHNATS